MNFLITLYSGTPGSGKSLHTASVLYWWNRSGLPCICNFPIALDKVAGHKEKHFSYVSNDRLTPQFLIEYAHDFMQKTGKVKEDSILLVIDECQLMFNARDWGRQDRSAWLSFFTMHRHLGYRIILVAQFDRMLDRQVRSLIEYEFIHRKLGNFGWKGKLITLIAFGEVFVSVKVWYPMKTKVGSELFRAKKMYYSLYDSYAMFDMPD